MSTKNQKRMDEVHAVMRLGHYSILTERSYCDWIKRQAMEDDDNWGPSIKGLWEAALGESLSFGRSRHRIYLQGYFRNCNPGRLSRTLFRIFGRTSLLAHFQFDILGISLWMRSKSKKW